MADVDRPGFAQALERSVDTLRLELAAFIADRPVQTNEAARGLCWLLPTAYTGWNAVHLVELGASAGLNLVAEEHGYVLSAADNVGEVQHIFGQGREAQFLVQGEGGFASPALTAVPQIVSRTGCDLAPIRLHKEAERLYLAAFVWADQPDRMRVLRQAIKTLLRINNTDRPVRLQTCCLPHELPAFLHTLPKLKAPCILYNSYLTAYLPDKGKGVQAQIARWATVQQQPVLWLQWEHLPPNDRPPAFGWLGWTAQLWHQGRQQSWHLAWVHPHGSRVDWLPGISAWHKYWQQKK